VDNELGCGLIGSLVQAPTVRDEPLFIVVDGRQATDQGPFVLSLSERRTACGDGIREPSEQCDDGNDNEADGCSSACALNPTELEPNDTMDDQNAFENPFYAEISPASDVDWVQFEVPEDAGVTVRVSDLGDGSCGRNSMDPLLRVYDENAELVAENDDGGDGFCATLELLPLAPGSYAAEISRVSAGTETFPYRLIINQTPVEP
jgi:cysteine-rich repeat protein